MLLLDLSIAFDTIDHNIILSRLQSHLGVCDVVLQWFRSYLSERKHCVLINGLNSKGMPLAILYWAQFSSLYIYIYIYICIRCPFVRSSTGLDYNIICTPMTATFILHSALQMVAIVWPIWRLSFVI